MPVTHKVCVKNCQTDDSATNLTYPAPSTATVWRGARKTRPKLKEPSADECRGYCETGGELLSTQWTKSSYSGHNGACVEARLSTDGVEVRDSKDLEGPTLHAPASEWASLIAVTKRIGN